MTMLHTRGLGIPLPRTKLDKGKLATFRETFQAASIDTTAWGGGGAKSIEHLFWETYEQRGCVITGSQVGKIKRVTRLVKIRLVAEIFGATRVLYSRMQVMHDGRMVERKQVPLGKLRWDEMAADDLLEATEAFYAEDCAFAEPWKIACSKTLEKRLGLSQAWQAQHLVEDVDSYRYFIEDDCESDGYPGLNTMYCIHEVTFHVRDTEHAGVIGLPTGQEFATAEGDFNLQDEHGLAIGTQLNIWTWLPEAQAEEPAKESRGVPRERSAEALGTAERRRREAQLCHRVPLPTVSAQVLAGMQARLSGIRPRFGGGAGRAGLRLAPAPHGQSPSAALRSCMRGLTTDWPRVKQIASSIRKPAYSLHDFQQDLLAFPELNLYLLDEDSASWRAGAMGRTTTSGRTVGDEYQRTLGAFFAVYWLFRLDIDGKEGFSNGVDAQWRPIALDKVEEACATAPDKRMAFHRDAQWGFFTQLLVDAGLLERRPAGLAVNEQRLVSLLALTAVHDIMKMSLILPEVSAEHAPYHGYAAGETIGDHDHALAYVMDHYPDMLPSFRDLPPEERRSVQFTQCNVSFNHGWFVQAEAPPGAIFTRFREALIRDHKSQIRSRDVAFYFVHWLTDLAGAEPTPLAGCEKFVVKFPLPVLNSFLRSFEFVERIAAQTETQVMEDYLRVRWAEGALAAGLAAEPPTGPGAIAKMRLMCMAQTSAPKILEAFEELGEEDREVLGAEMARTGCVGQSFAAEPADPPLDGPAFLVYYGPAYLQNLGSDSATKRLGVLAELYRCARELWPASIAKVSTNVTVRIDMIKSLNVADMKEATTKGDVWTLVKHNDSEAFVERSSTTKLNTMVAAGQQFQVLDLAGLAAYA